MVPGLGVISVASPCSQSWDRMAGDERVRHCGVCDKNVYSLDTLSAEEVRQLVLKNEGRICWRFFVRRDGTVLTRDCPVGLRRVRQRAFAVAGSVCALLLASTAGLLRQAGWWDWSQELGSFSARLANGWAARAPQLVAAKDARRGEHTSGIRIR